MEGLEEQSAERYIAREATVSPAIAAQKTHFMHTLPTKYNPYPTPPITVAMINQSLQSRLGGLGYDQYAGFGRQAERGWTYSGGGCH